MEEILGDPEIPKTLGFFFWDLWYLRCRDDFAMSP